MLAAQAPDLHEALQEVAEQGWSHVVLDGKLIRTDRCAETTDSVKGETINAWYSGKHRAPGGNVQAVIRPDGATDLDLRRRARSPARPDRRPRRRRHRRAELGRRPSSTCPPWPTPATTAPATASRRRSSSPPAGRALPRTTWPTTRCTALDPLPRRTRLRPAHRPLASPATRHRQPPPNRRTRPGRARPHTNREPSATHCLLRSAVQSPEIVSCRVGSCP